MRASGSNVLRVSAGPFGGWPAGVLLVAAALLWPQAVPHATAASDAFTNAATVTAGLESSGKSLPDRLKEAQAQLTVMLDSGFTNVPAGVPMDDVWRRRGGLQRLVWFYEEQLKKSAALEKAKIRKSEVRDQARAWTRFTEPPPYSILLTDRLREEIQAEKQKIRSGEKAVPVLNELVEDGRKDLRQAEEKIRQLNEQLETASDAATRARLSWQRELQLLNGQVAAGGLGVLDLDRQLAEEALAESGFRLGLLQRQLLIAEPDAAFTQADMEQVTARIGREREQLQRESTQAEARRQVAAQALEVARAELRQGSSPRSIEVVSAREAQLDTAEVAISILRLLLEVTNVERTMWEMRFEVQNKVTFENLRESERRLDTFTRRLELWLHPVRQQLEVSTSQVQLQEKRVNSLPADSELRPPAQERVEALREREQLLLRSQRAMVSMQLLTQRWAEGLRDSESKLPLVGRVRNLFSDTRSFVGRLWEFEVFTAEDTITVDGQKITGKRSVTIGKIVMALLILVAGYWFTGLISRTTEKVLVRRLHLDANEANLIRRWLRAFLLLCLLMFSLVSVKIPLTVFAFAGGALAIGLGFGMQTVLKNFVSGLILLFERPFRVGDVLDVGGQKGAVTSIGLRASVLQLWDGTETLIPNSSLLENNVTNWTYSNRQVRFEVSVGVAYGSDPRRVMKLLAEAAERHGLVEKVPEPQVLFTEFGDSTLNFALRFWTDVTKANAAQVASDLRLMIASSFAEAGIEIAFPQRDIHLNTVGPLRVEVVPGKEQRVEI